MEITVRELLGFAELKKIQPLVQQANQEIDDSSFQHCLESMIDEGYRCIGAFLEEALVGICGFWVGTRFWCGSYIEPDNLMVDESRRGLRVGAALMGWIEEEGARLGCKVVKLEAYANRMGTRAFYERLGYAEPGVLIVKPLGEGAHDWWHAIKTKTAS